ncbi:MAG: hypothetical protein P4L82_03330 [Ancalomicrobiaceae bacterium]|nr:hypothetical protein [Ancalomicrobiaceae bacterium]
MLEEVGRPYPAHATGSEPLEYGQVMNLQLSVPDIETVHSRVIAAGLPLLVPMGIRRYQTHVGPISVRQFVVADPDGFIVRPQQDLPQG